MRIRIKKFINKYHFELMILIFVILFPIIMGILHQSLINPFLDIRLDSLLSFYGVSAGILTSFMTYTYESKKSKITRIKEVKPDFFVEIKNLEKDLFTLKVENHSSSPIRYIYYYDEYIGDSISKTNNYKITYSRSVTDVKKLNPDYNFTIDDNIIDEQDGYPKYFQLICDDIDGNCWILEYRKIHDGNRIFYYPSKSEIET